MFMEIPTILIGILQGPFDSKHGAIFVSSKDLSGAAQSAVIVKEVLERFVFHSGTDVTRCLDDHGQ